MDVRRDIKSSITVVANNVSASGLATVSVSAQTQSTIYRIPAPSFMGMVYTPKSATLCLLG